MLPKPYYETDNGVLYNGDCLDIMREMESDSVQCVVTSPPYWGLRDYGLPPRIWDGDPDCEHEWNIERTKRSNASGGHNCEIRKTHGTENYSEYTDYKDRATYSNFCIKCGAWKGTFGLEPTPELYIKHGVTVFREVRRVLRPDGTLWLNMGDSYIGGGRGGLDGCGKGSMEEGRYQKGQRIGLPTGRIEGLKPKDLCMMPARLALALQADGWYLRSDIIWNKPNPMPESVTDRPTKAHEYLFLLTKSGKPTFWTHRDHGGTDTKPKADYRWINKITEIEVSKAPPDWKEIIICPKCDGTGIAMVDLGYEVMGQWCEVWGTVKCPVCNGKKKTQKWKRINLWRGHDYYYDAEAIKDKYTEPLNRWGGPALKEETEKHSKYLDMQNIGGSSALRAGRNMRPDPSGRNKRSVWTIATQPFPEAHFATFPEKLVIPCILAGTSEKGNCSVCGKPWVRVIEKESPPSRVFTKTKVMNDKGDFLYTPRKNGIKVGAGQKYQNWREDHPPKTIGWQPSCSCNADTVKPIVLDPFGGSCTVAKVCEAHGRRWVMCELSQEYCDIGKKRVGQEAVQPRFA